VACRYVGVVSGRVVGIESEGKEERLLGFVAASRRLRKAAMDRDSRISESESGSESGLEEGGGVEDRPELHLGSGLGTIKSGHKRSVNKEAPERERELYSQANRRSRPAQSDRLKAIRSKLPAHRSRLIAPRS